MRLKHCTVLLLATLLAAKAAGAQSAPAVPLTGSWQCAFDQTTAGITASTRGTLDFAPSGQAQGQGTLSMTHPDTNTALRYAVNGNGSWALSDNQLTVQVQRWTYTPTSMLANLAPDAPRALLPQMASAQFSVDALDAHTLIATLRPDNVTVRCSRP